MSLELVERTESFEDTFEDMIPSLERSIVFDVDGTLIDFEDQPRWEVIDMLRAFHAIGYRILVWSGGGASYAGYVVRRLGLSGFVSQILSKGDAVEADYAVDDMPDADFKPGMPVILV